jgi:hypothetical protein
VQQRAEKEAELKTQLTRQREERHAMETKEKEYREQARLPRARSRPLPRRAARPAAALCSNGHGLAGGPRGD